VGDSNTRENGILGLQQIVPGVNTLLVLKGSSKTQDQNSPEFQQSYGLELRRSFAWSECPY
jgi:hypothetical protein